MGMSASQLRLLALTSAMHDIELKAQRIQAEKISLATKEDAAYEKYCEALDATKIQVGQLSETGSTVYIDANYANTCGFNPDNRRQYALINNRNGYVIVPEGVKEMYQEYPNDKYSFAWAMMGFEDSEMFEYGDCVGIGWGDGDFEDGNGYEDDDGECSLYMTPAEFAVFSEHYGEDDTNATILTAKYDALVEAVENDDVSNTEKQKLLNEFRDQLYKSYGSEIFNAMVLEDTEDPESYYDDDYEGMCWGDISAEFNYYVNLFTQIKEAGGCETIDSELKDGDRGTEWFNNMISSGQVSIMMCDKNSGKGWQETSIATNIGNNYLMQVSDDKLVKKAEAEYEHEMKLINRKDTKFDTELKALETQESAYKTELDSIKTVIKDNIDKNFNIFS